MRRETIRPSSRLPLRQAASTPKRIPSRVAMTREPPTRRSVQGRAPRMTPATGAEWKGE